MKKKKISFLIIAFTLVLIFCGGFLTFEAISMSENAVVEAATTYSENIEIQKRLKRWGYYSGSIDGIYGPLTRKAVIYFQRRNGLVQDGIVGPKTAAAIGINLKSTNNSSDKYLLAQCINAEARGEPYTGQVAVGAVILNRVDSPKFPNSIAGVIYQPWAFSSVNDGQINLRPSSSALKAAQDALNGWDPTYGCIYFYNPSTATSKWIFNTRKVVTIGKHVFSV